MVDVRWIMCVCVCVCVCAYVSETGREGVMCMVSHTALVLIMWVYSGLVFYDLTEALGIKELVPRPQRTDLRVTYSISRKAFKDYLRLCWFSLGLND